MKLQPGKLLALVLGAVLIAGFVWSTRAHPPHTAPARTEAPISVRVAAIERTRVPEFAEAFGGLRAAEEIVVAARLTGAVRTVAVRPGQPVAAGDLLVELDAADLAARVAQAEANLLALERSSEEAQREARRTASLFERDARSSQELESAQTHEAEVAARVVAANEALNAARTALGHARIVAPMDALVAERYVDPGDLAQPGTGLIALHSLGPLRLEAELSASLLAGVALGDELPIAVDALGPDAPELSCVVVEIEPAVDPRTRTAVVKLQLTEPRAGLLPGMFGRVLVPTGEREALVVPRAAVVGRGQLELLFVPSADDSAVRMHVVRMGRLLPDDRVELLTGPLDAERAVVSGAESLRDGSLVRIGSMAGGAGH